mmetsp:Transcript_27115/g.37251  ORF Transcript_27115/g.37251 Transcript_27115/m.37251 type:complete len:729 (-) Transcript_27115:253-2439(-)
MNETISEQPHPHFSVFGLESAVSLDTSSVALMLFLIIMSAIAIEKAFEMLSSIADDTPFYNLLPAAEKQLMVAGMTAFIFKVYINSTTDASTTVIHSLEFADTLVPIFSFLTCLVGLCLIFFSSNVCDKWSKAHQATTSELLFSFSQVSSYMPKSLSMVTWQVEFKIFHHMFFDKYKIDPNSIPFDEYIELQFEKFILEIIEISPSTWSLFGVYMLWLYLRHLVPLMVVEKHEDVYKYANSFLASCCITILIGVVIVAISRYYEMNAMQYKGVLSPDYYKDYLLYEDNKSEERKKNRTAESSLLEQQNLKDMLARFWKAKNRKASKGFFFQNMSEEDHFHTASSAQFHPIDDHPISLNMSNTSWLESFQNLFTMERKTSRYQVSDSSDQRYRKLLPNSSGKTVLIDVSENTFSQGDLYFAAFANVHPSNSVYLFSSPWLYFSIMKFQVMNITIHLAVWLVQVLPTHSLGWLFQTILFIMILVAFALYFIAAKSAVILHVMDHLDAELLLQVIEQTDGARSLEKEIRDGILTKLNMTHVDYGDINLKIQLLHIFNEIDVDKSGELSRGELATFLGTLDIHFSKRKWKQVFRLMDRSQEESNNTISFQEFFLFVFPQFVAAELQRQNEELKNERKRSEMTSGLYQLDNGSVSILSRVNMSFRRSTQILPPSFAVSPITPNHTSLDEINHPIPEENHNNPNQEDEKSSCDSESDGENNQGIAIQPDNTQEE